ncbi:MAG: PEGA domain-containing protein [Deltaproteobacteria bacterium]|nr:PEGA domain-containing protein [Deltaproteobacteria bacterium]
MLWRLVVLGIASAALVPLHALAQESQKIVAVLEFRNEAGLTAYESGTVTDLLRIAAREKLPEREYIVMTRENMVKLLPPGTDLSKCVQAECEVDIGRQIGADFVVAGEVGRFGSALQVKMKLYDTKSGDLLSGQIAEARDTDGLKDPIKSKASVLFAKLTARAEAAGAEWVPEGAEKKVIVPFESEPGGAVVLVDGKVVCQKTPCSKGVTEGLHQVSMQIEGYSPRTGRVDIQKGAAVLFKLVRDAGWLTVQANTQDVVVKVNGAEKGKAPVARLELPAGRYEVSGTAPCHYDETQKVVLEPGAEKTVTLAPKPKVGAIDVAAEDEKGNEIEADVFVDGKRVGTAPGLFKVSVCAKSLVVEHRGQRFIQDLRVPEKTVVNVSARLSQRAEAQPKAPEYFPAWAVAPNIPQRVEAQSKVPERQLEPVAPVPPPVSQAADDGQPKSEVVAEKPARPVPESKPPEEKEKDQEPQKEVSPDEKTGKEEKLHSIGLVAGASWAYFNSSADYKTGFTGGLAVDFGVSRYFSVRPELLVSMKGNDHFDGASGNTYTYTLTYVELPVLAKVSLATEVFVPELYAGPYFASLATASKEGSSDSQDVDEMFDKMDFGFIFGGGFRLNFSDWALLFDFDYSLGVVSILTYGDKKNTALSVTGGVAYKF